MRTWRAERTEAWHGPLITDLRPLTANFCRSLTRAAILEIKQRFVPRTKNDRLVVIVGQLNTLRGGPAEDRPDPRVFPGKLWRLQSSSEFFGELFSLSRGPFSSDKNKLATFPGN